MAGKANGIVRSGWEAWRQVDFGFLPDPPSPIPIFSFIFIFRRRRYTPRYICVTPELLNPRPACFPLFLIPNHSSAIHGTELIPARYTRHDKLLKAREGYALVPADSPGDFFIAPSTSDSRQNATFFALEHKAQHIYPDTLCGVRAPP